MMLEFDDDESEPYTASQMLEALYRLYLFESPRVAGAHGGRPGFRPWSKAQFLDDNQEVDAEVLDHLLHLLREKKQLMTIPSSEGGPKRYLTRTAEMVRTIGTVHEYVNRKTEDDEDDEGDGKHLQIIEATKWVPALSERPARDLTLEDFIEEFSDDLDARGIRTVRGRAAREAVEITRLALTAIAGVVVRGNPERFRLTRFQGRAIKQALIASWSGGEESSIIICAGTSSGKTIGFAAPVLVDAVLDSLERRPPEGPRWTQLMLYPRNDLAFDQYSTIKEYCGAMNELLRDRYGESAYLTVALDAGGYVKNYNEKIPGVEEPWDHKEWDQKSINVVDASSSRYGGSRPANPRDTSYRPANIMIASSESFRRRLVLPEVSKAVSESLKRVVLDEIHLAEGIQGGHLRGLFDRLTALRRGSRPLFIAASATISEPERHVQSVWGTRADNVDVVEPSDSEKSGAASGIVNHVLVRPRAGVTKGGPVYNTTSLVGHQSRGQGWVDARESSSEELNELDKMLCFADSREFVGRWQMLMNENEGGMNAHRISSAQLSRGGKTGRAITLPYAHWYDRPLAQQLGHSKVCESCKKVGSGAADEKLPESVTVRSEIIREFRTKWGGRSVPEPFKMENWKPDSEGNIEVNALDKCPHLQAGTCWWFSQGTGPTPLTEENHIGPIADSVTERPGDGGHSVFQNGLRFRRHTAETRGQERESDGLSLGDNQFSADSLFEHNSGEAYPPEKPGSLSGPRIVYDAIIATPTLEVGVDMERVGEVITHRAMRNVSSYRQKAGRAGRENNSIATIVTILSRRPGDYQFYRDDHKLILQELREPVPVANGNRMVMRSQAYMCALDWLCAVKSRRIESIGSPDWIAQMEAAVEDLRGSESEAVDWIWRGFRESCLGKNDVRRAVRTLAKHLRLITEGEYGKAGGSEVRICKELVWANGQRRDRREGSKYQRIAKPASAPGRLDDDKISKLRDHHRIAKEALPDALSEDIGDAIDEIGRWFDSPDGSTDPHVEILRSLTSEVETEIGGAKARSAELFHDLKYSLERLRMEIEQYEHSDDSPTDLSHQLAGQIHSTWTDMCYYYLSWLLGECDAFLGDSPYCYVEKSFINPHELRINVKLPDKQVFRRGRIEWVPQDKKQDIGQVLRDLLPGTWTLRLATSGSGHALKSPVGGAGLEPGRVEDNLDGMWIADVAMRDQPKPSRGVDGTTPSVKPAVEGGADLDYRLIPPMIRMRHDKKNIQIVAPKFLNLHHEYGMSAGDATQSNIPSKVWYSATGGRVSGMDKEHDREVDKPGQLPEAWPCRWIITSPEEPEQVLAFSPSKNKARQGEAGLHPARTHPLFNRVFSGIEYSSALKTKDIVVGIHRTGGIAIRYRVDEEDDVVFGRVFDTNGIKHTISQSVIEEFDRRSENWRDQPFDLDSLRIVQHHLERLEVSPDTDRFSNRHLVKALLLQIHLSDESELPETLGEAVEHWSAPIDQEAVDMYLLGIRANVRELVTEGMNEIVPVYRTRVDNEKAWAEEEIVKSAREWHRYAFLNTLGKVMVEAVSSFTGVEEQRIGFSIETGLDEHGGGMAVTIFDDDSAGNGCCEALRRHYMISETAKSANGEMRAPPLPTTDFASLLEGRMLVCSEHLANRAAIDIHCGREVPRRLLNMVGRQAKSLNSRYSDIWEELNIRTLRRAEMMKEISPVLRNHNFAGMSVDEIDQALHVCSTGCFVCQGAPMTSAIPSPALAERYTSRALLDTIFDLSPTAEGYADGRDRDAIPKFKGKSHFEVYPHWHHDKDQEFVKPVTPIPRQVSMYWVPRDSVLPLPETIRLVRHLDHLGVYD